MFFIFIIRLFFFSFLNLLTIINYLIKIYFYYFLYYIEKIRKIKYIKSNLLYICNLKYFLKNYINKYKIILKYFKKNKFSIIFKNNSFNKYNN